MKHLVVVLPLVAAMAAPASADPGPPAGAAAKAGKKGDAKSEKKADEKRAKKPEKKSDKKKAGPRLRVADPDRSRRINLFPEKVLGSTRHTPEDRHRLTLGDDRDWKVQAAQVGAMAAVFGALVGLCGGGKCMIPGGATDFLPGWMRAEPTTYDSPRREQPLREAH